MVISMKHCIGWRSTRMVAGQRRARVRLFFATLVLVLVGIAYSVGANDSEKSRLADAKRDAQLLLIVDDLYDKANRTALNLYGGEDRDPR